VLYAGLVALLLTPAAMAVHAQTAGTTTLGVSVTELSNVINGWSVREQLLGEEIGKIDLRHCEHRWLSWPGFARLCDPRWPVSVQQRSHHAT
jgi:hypothetical protein